MAKIKQYHRPQSLDEAMDLLTQPDTTLLAGGTQLVAQADETLHSVIDLQAVGLDTITPNGDRLEIGAMATLQALMDHAQTPALITEMTLHEGPNTFRNIGTVGGVIAAADPESELFAAFLVYGATVSVRSGAGDQTVPLENLVLEPGMLITQISIPSDAHQTASARVARTPADRAIVAVVGRKDGQNEIRLAICGVASHPILLPENLDTLTPSGDFRGSADYRAKMARVLSGRVQAELGE